MASNSLESHKAGYRQLAFCAFPAESAKIQDMDDHPDWKKLIWKFTKLGGNPDAATVPQRCCIQTDAGVMAAWLE